MAEAGQMLHSSQEGSLHDILSMIANAKPIEGHLAAQDPLRCIFRTIGADASTVLPYRAGEPYMAVSYTWPGSWQRLYASLQPSPVVRDEECGLSEHVSLFMTLVFDFILATEPSKRMLFWVDQACIRQEDEVEKAQQVASMDRIYTGARQTIVLLEDIELTTEEFNTLNNWQPKSAEEREQYLRLTRKVLSARWFERAWCSQEMILSRYTKFYLHRTEEPRNPIQFTVVILVAWLNIARIYEANIPTIAEPRGHIDYSRLGSVAFSSHAWAYAVIHPMKCYNLYDKIALVQNLVRMPQESRLTFLPDSGGADDHVADLNVGKVINALAVQSGDYSLLQTGHTAGSVELQSQQGFSWAGIPTGGDIISGAWHPRQYHVDQDRDVTLTSSGLRLRGLLAAVRKQVLWKMHREGDALHVMVDGSQRTIRPTWLRSSAVDHAHNAGPNSYDREQRLSRLRDILYAIEAVGADHLWPTFMPADGNWIIRGPDDGIRSERYEALRDRIWKEYNRPSAAQKSMAQAVEFYYHGPVTTFRELTMYDGTTLVVDGNAPGVTDRQIFQPFVMRLNEFGSDRIACNMIVLQDAETGASGDARRCLGHLRSFQRLPDTAKVATIMLQ